MATTLVAEDWTLDPLEPKGAEELYRRMQAAEPRRVRRTELEGHVGLTARELYELGCTLAPLGVLRAGGMAVWRLAVTAAVLIAAIGVAGAALSSLDALGVERGEDDPLDPARNLALVVFFLAAAYGGIALMRLGIRKLRELAAARRRAAGHAARHPVDDPNGRATVASLRGPGVLRVQLLWVRGDARNPSYAEIRTLAERRVDEDDAGRAEDAVAALSELALRADNAHALRRHGGLAALGLRKRRRRSGDRLPASDPSDDGDGPKREVPSGWEPEPLTDEGQAEIARRLVTAKPERWSASVLEPLIVDGTVGAPREPPPWPKRLKAGAPRLNRRAIRWLAVGGIATFVLAMYSGDDGPPSAGAVAIGVAGLAATLLAIAVPWLFARRRTGARVARAVRAAAASPPRALEQGLPGAAGLFAVARARGRIALLHVRPAPDDGRDGDLEVRTVATRRIADDDLDALTTFSAIAAEARLRAEGVGRSTHYVRTLMARLGRVPARAGEPALWREPLAWVAAGLVGLLVAASIKHTLAGTWLEDGLAGRTISFAWVLVAACLALTAARRVRDPFTL